MFKEFNPLSANFTRWSNTLKQFVGKLPKNCFSKRFVCKLPTSFFSVFDHFVGLALKGLSTYRTIKGAMVVNIKNIVHVCSNTLLSIFLRRDHSFPNNISITLIDKTDPSSPLQREHYWRNALKTVAPRHGNWTLKAASEIASYHWICMDSNKDFIYGNDFGTCYYCYYFHHYHCCCHFYHSVTFIVAFSVIVLLFFVSLILVLVWLLSLLLSFL